MVKKVEDDLKLTEEKSKENEKEKKTKEDVKVTDLPKVDELPSNGDEAEGKKKSQEINSKLEERKKDHELSEPFTKVNPCGPPAPLWPNSCLDKVLDHDPVLTRIKVTLKRTILLKVTHLQLQRNE